MPGFFSPDGANAVSSRPGAVEAALSEGWCRDATHPGAGNGTVVTATLLNQIIANLRATVTGLGGPADGSDTMLYDAIAVALMAKATYDPNSFGVDAFSMSNMVEGADAKILTANERQLLDWLSVTGPVDLDEIASHLTGAIAFTGILTPDQITADQDDYAPSDVDNAVVLRLDADAEWKITGLSGGTDGRLMIVHNIGAELLTLSNDDAGSTASNRFLFPSDIVMATDQSVWLQYDIASSRWRAIGGTGGSGVVKGAVSLTEPVVPAGVDLFLWLEPENFKLYAWYEDGDGDTGWIQIGGGAGSIINIIALTVLSSVDPANDYVAVHDATDGTVKRVLPNVLVAGVEKTGGMHKLAEGTISNVATLDLDLSSWIADYRAIEIVLANLMPATDNTSLVARLSADGVTFAAGASDYKNAIFRFASDGVGVNGGSNGSTTIWLENGGTGNATNEGTRSVRLRIELPGVAKLQSVDIVSQFMNYTGYELFMIGCGVRQAVAIAHSIRFFYGTGNIASGSYAIYGVK